MHISSWTQTKGILFFLYLPPLLCRWLSFSIHSWYSTTAPSPSQLALLVELTWLIQLTHVWKVPVPTGGPAGQSGTAMIVTAPSGMMGGTARKVSRSALFLPNWLFFFLAQWHVWGSFLFSIHPVTRTAMTYELKSGCGLHTAKEGFWARSKYLFCGMQPKGILYI